MEGRRRAKSKPIDTVLLEQAREDEISKVVSDKEYQQKLFEEFGI